ncbi:uncharacterized protein BXZ73DRAFT_50522 [Epithele typhae]|uniref:uncharacterized protein n=1 Tax=Epithele typhae TaxID=378194 RepID=UPI0020079D83|nr:uncharacterized protein BXZ73DRAFT_50522 [Epithele typhae]KAH9924266.1 hypothetical protein BXZ73DRAFT_50522 [Epithele typhae]
MRPHSLPSDIWISVLQYLSVGELANLSSAAKYFHALIHEYGWKLYLRNTPRKTWSLFKSMQLWSAHASVRYHTEVDRNWARPHFVARPLSSKWQGKLQPQMAINKSRLFVAAGSTIYSYTFGHSDEGRTPGIQFECAYMTHKVVQASRDITSIQCVPDGGFDRTVYVGYADGTLERIVLPACKLGAPPAVIHLESNHREKRPYHGTDIVESISANKHHLLSLSCNGFAAFFTDSGTDSPPQFLELNVRGWTTHLSDRYAFLGTSSLTPLMVYTINESRLSAQPAHVLTSSTHDDRPRASAVYGISSAPPSSPWGSSDRVVLSGWYDGVVNVHDLRSARRDGAGALYPVMSMCDPWLPEPIYDVTAGGSSGCHVAAGTARHSLVAFWDVRAARRGWSVHAPGNDPSPVYSVVLESSRLFGATQSRPFVLDFGPGARADVYPQLTRPPKEEGLKKRDGSGVGFYVTRYGHSRA